MKLGTGFTLCSAVTQPLLRASVAGLLIAATATSHSDYALQEPAVHPAPETPSTSQGAPQSRGPQDSRPRVPGKPQKLRKWTGNLVDAGCFTNVLRRVPSIDETLFPDPLSGFWQTLQSSQRAAQDRKSGGWSPQGQPQTASQTGWAGDSDGEPDASERQIAMQTAQLKRAKALEQVVKACSPGPPTTHYGMLVSGGQLLQFDSAGDFKAKEAINVSVVEPGKVLKVKVAGVIRGEGTIQVAAIEFARRIPAARVSSGQ